MTTTEQALALGAKTWSGRGGSTRYYLNDWPSLIGIDVRSLSNNEESRVRMFAYVYVEDGQLNVIRRRDMNAPRMPLTVEGVAERVAAALAAAV